MRLLYSKGAGKYSLTREFAADEDVPAYAILSHTWIDGQEVTFEDIRGGGGRGKSGYNKINFFAQQANKDGLEYFWVDACCIDKSNPAELQEAIKSMFRRYQNAAKCYVYLLNVSKAGGRDMSQQEFRQSPWFTRPMQHRQTTAAEDKAYALLGIFGVEMNLRCGEGYPSASKQLEEKIGQLNSCLRDLRITDPRHDKQRIEETKGGLLDGVYRWILENPDFQKWHDNKEDRLLWIKGDPGKGKTMLLCGIINELESSISRIDLLSYFFCQATDSRINSATSLLCGLLSILINRQPLLISHITKKHDLAGRAIFEDSNAWFALTEVFMNILQDSRLTNTYFIIDALDECRTDLHRLSYFTALSSSRASPRVKWIISSCHLPDIEEGLQKAQFKVQVGLEFNSASVSATVHFYIEHSVPELSRAKQYKEVERRDVMKLLISHAANTFLWVAIVCLRLRQEPRRRLPAILKESPDGLDALYDQMLQQVGASRDCDLLKQILAVIKTAYRPITIRELSRLNAEIAEMIDDTNAVKEY
ncbi:uncharacterized protein Z519_10283 [Cladophialophora bantiana CBS 173.52]|uniref:NACHT domain-containing protein n=1 Tax=Cladophialophora bantiana (strain ATCC 10958 / CBS 173.52 / CDC B-1940 / NIH 8579) TaxID=1442370 RepID=A0A0D2HW41_CLAB1|nr:uncharacterized protein Z519_10283 [Cladophialophora bantiana CBS 173.52]KIW88799.1 hypothetical protein Z519_10283 [Cladophialophora bantiana CBS 173.52]